MRVNGEAGGANEGMALRGAHDAPWDDVTVGGKMITPPTTISSASPGSKKAYTRTSRAPDAGDGWRVNDPCWRFR